MAIGHASCDHGSMDVIIEQSVMLQGHTSFVRAVSFSPDGRYLVSGSNDRTCRVWNKDNNGMWQSVKLQGHTRTVRAISFSPDGSFFVSIAEDSIGRIWQRDPYNVWQAQDNSKRNTETSEEKDELTNELTKMSL